MRHEKAGALLDLARRLAGSAEGLTLDEMAASIGVSRRTAERMRDAIWALFPQMEEMSEGLTKRFRIPRGLDGFLTAPTTGELAELSKAITALRESGRTSGAEALGSLERKVRSALRTETLRRLAPDLDALARAEIMGLRAGPRPHEDSDQIALLRQALLAMRAIRFRYLGGSRPGTVRTVAPYGLLFERTNYLVAAEVDREEPVNWRLDRIADLEILDVHAPVPETFSLSSYAARSFGIYQDGVEDIALLVSPKAAEEARRWRFHPTQATAEQPDGSLLVTFRTGGLRELAWHLMTWRDTVQVLAPDRLREELLSELQLGLDHHAQKPKVELDSPSKSANESIASETDA